MVARIMLSKLLLLWGFAVGAGVVCVNTGCFVSARPNHGCDTETTCSDELATPDAGGTTSAEVVAPAPIPVADWREPSPVNESAPDQGQSGSEGIDGGITQADTGIPFLDQPRLGWGNSITILDLLEFLPAATLEGILDPITDNPGSFTTLELLCRDEGFTDSFCRSRYGSR